MAIEGCGRAAQVTLIIINCLAAIVSLVAVGLGLWTRFDRQGVNATMSLLKSSTEHEKGLQQLIAHISVSSNLWIICGCAVFCLSFIGCMGAWRQSKAFLSIYTSLIGLLILIELAIIIALATYGTRLEGQLHKGLTGAFKVQQKHYVIISANSTTSTKGGVDLRTVFSMIEANFKCCGLNGTRDYSKKQALEESSKDRKPLLLPNSCYTKMNQKRRRPYTKGCLSQVDGFLRRHRKAIVVLQVTLICVEIIGFILALTTCLWPMEDEENQEVQMLD